MKKGRTRKELEENLLYPISILRRRRNIPQKIKDNLLENNKIMGGNIQNIINNPKSELPNLDMRVLLLFTEQVHKYLKDELDNHRLIDPHRFFTKIEMGKARQYSGLMVIENDIKLPLTLESVIMIDYDKFVTTIPVKTLAEMSALLLNYNFDIQREAKKKIVKGEIIQEATLVMENVIEIKNHLEKGTLETTTVVINAGAGTSYTSEELIYNPETMELTINEGTVLDIVDGYHRCKASELAVNNNPDIDFKFIIQILNYTDEQAKRYQGQLAKATPITKTRQKQLSEERYADIIVNRLSNQSELRGKITNFRMPSLKNKELVTYNILADTIHDVFKLERVIDVHRAERFLKEFFDLFLGAYEEEFLINPLETRKQSLLVEGNMFIGYVILAGRLYDKKLQPSEILDIIPKIDFSISNPEWQELGILDSKKNLTHTDKLREAIKKYFNEIEVG